jgi:hypothetical protein
MKTLIVVVVFMVTRLWILKDNKHSFINAQDMLTNCKSVLAVHTTPTVIGWTCSRSFRRSL